jgi:hypothetical protein
MPITFRYDPELRIVFTTAEGLVSFRDIQDHIDRESEQNALGYRELVDATTASTDITSEQIRLLVRNLYTKMREGPFGPTALVTEDEALFGMARMFGILSELEGGPIVGVFRAFDEALNWFLRVG